MKSDTRMQSYVSADVVMKAERPGWKTGWTFKNKYDKIYFIKSINDPFAILSPAQQGLQIFICHTETIMTKDIHRFYCYYSYLVLNGNKYFACEKNSKQGN